MEKTKEMVSARKAEWAKPELRKIDIEKITSTIGGGSTDFAHTGNKS